MPPLLGLLWHVHHLIKNIHIDKRDDIVWNRTYVKFDHCPYNISGRLTLLDTCDGMETLPNFVNHPIK